MSWYDDSWTYRVKVTVASSKVVSDQANFPVYVDLSRLPAGFFAHVNSDGGDIRITTSDGVTECAREVVFINTGSLTGELHFLAPLLSSSASTDFYIYYGNSGASEPAVSATYGRNAVWAAYIAVHHFQESVSPYADSTGNGFTLSDSTGTSGDVAGKLSGRAVDLTSNQVITYSGSGLPTGDVSFSAWLNQPTRVANSVILQLQKDTSSQYRNLSLGTALQGYASQVVRVSAATAQSDRAGGISAATWQLLTAVFQSTSLEAFLNGVTDGATSVTSLSPTAPNKYFSSGACYLDEARILNFAPSADWITTGYNNQSSASTFLSIGSQETQGGGGGGIFQLPPRRQVVVRTRW